MAQTFPSKLGRYQIVKHLANGGMAQVLLARATGIEGFERHVVVKRIHSDRAEDPVFVKMFLDEARLAAQLHHNNIVQVHDIGKEKGEYFFAMEYVHGEDLRKLLMKVNKKKEKVPFEHVVTIVTTAALALHHAHEQRGPDRKPLGLVHRDVSPANIIVGYDGNVKVVDFGIAKAALRAQRDDTKAGSLKGKVSYMAPEQCAGQQVDRRSDVYSLGIVLFELSTVRRLFKGNNDFLTMSAIVQGQIPKPSSYRADIPPELEAIIVRALSLDPNDRYQSTDEMREALEQFAAAKGLRTSTGALAQYMKQLFGLRPEPWLVGDDPTIELDLSVDFDGNEVGAAKAPETAEHQLEVPLLIEPTPSSPILRARKKAATDGSALIKAAVASGAVPTVRPTLPPPSIASRKTPPSMPATATIPTPVPKHPSTPARPTPQPVVEAKPDRLSTKQEEVKQAKAALADLSLDEPAVVVADDLAESHATPDVPIEPVAAAEPLVPKKPILPPLEPLKPPPKDDWTNGQPTTGSALAWPADITAAPTSSPKKKLLAIGGVLVLAAGAALFVAMRSGNEDDPGNPPTPAKGMDPQQQATPPPPNDPPPPPPNDPPPAQDPPPTQDPPPPDPGSAAAVEPPKEVGSASEPATGSAGSGEKPKKPRKKKEQWNPDQLFLPEAKKK